MVLLIVTLFTLYTGSVNAAEIKSFTPLTNIPLLESWQPGEEFEGSTKGVFNQLFSLSIRIGAMLAVFMFIWGGLHFITARDNPTSITKGREKMKNAVFGLLMLLSTFVVLNTINPELLNISFLGEGTVRLDATPIKSTEDPIITPDGKVVAHCYIRIYHTRSGHQQSETICSTSLSECDRLYQTAKDELSGTFYGVLSTESGDRVTLGSRNKYICNNVQVTRGFMDSFSQQI